MHSNMRLRNLFFFRFAEIVSGETMRSSVRSKNKCLRHLITRQHCWLTSHYATDSVVITSSKRKESARIMNERKASLYASAGALDRYNPHLWSSMLPENRKYQTFLIIGLL